MSRRRLDADAIRDSVLFVSGSLDLSHPPNPVVPTYPQRPSERRRRPRAGIDRIGTARTLYLPILRDLVPRELTVFDLPDPELVTGARNITTVPTQALYMLNSPFITEQSRKVAERLRQRRSRDAKRVDQPICWCWAGRRASPSGTTRLQFLAEFPATQEPPAVDSLRGRP